MAELEAGFFSYCPINTVIFYFIYKLVIFFSNFAQLESLYPIIHDNGKNPLGNPRHW